MFRYSMRELLLVTMLVGLGTGWWEARQRMCEARADARFLANVAEWGCRCQMVYEYEDLCDKYGVERKKFGNEAVWNALSAMRRAQRRSN